MCVTDSPDFSGVASPSPKWTAHSEVAPEERLFGRYVRYVGGIVSTDRQSAPEVKTIRQSGGSRTVIVRSCSSAQELKNHANK